MPRCSLYKNIWSEDCWCQLEPTSAHTFSTRQVVNSNQLTKTRAKQTPTSRIHWFWAYNGNRLSQPVRKSTGVDWSWPEL